MQSDCCHPYPFTVISITRHWYVLEKFNLWHFSSYPESRLAENFQLNSSGLVERFNGFEKDSELRATFRSMRRRICRTAKFLTQRAISSLSVIVHLTKAENYLKFQIKTILRISL